MFMQKGKNIYWNVRLKSNQGFQKEKEKESTSVSEPVNKSSITSFITKEETVGKADIL